MPLQRRHREGYSTRHDPPGTELGRGALEIDGDGTADAFGAGAWTYLDCTGATPIEQRGSCRSAGR